MHQTAQPEERIAVVLFTGDLKREARQKRLPPRLLANLHRQLVRMVDRSRNLDLLRVFRSEGITYLETRDGRTEISRLSALDAEVREAIALTLARGYQKMILLAGDICTFEGQILRDTVTQLSHDEPTAVIGRSGDGGFYLAGFNHFPAIDWSRVLGSPSSSASTLANEASAVGLHVAETKVVDDIDDLADAIRLSQRRAKGLLSRTQIIIRSIIKSTFLRCLVSPVFVERAFDLRRFQLPPPSPSAS